MLTVGSLFSGAGLCDLGFHRAGFRHQFFCEIDPWCRSILARHWPDVPIHSDIREVSGKTLPRVDVLTGGFPCQDVSCSGKRQGITPTTRSGLWHEYRRIIEEIRPRYAVIENVKGLLSKGMEIVLSDLSAIGYDAQWTCLQAASFGAPHYRERVFIVAYPHSRHLGGRTGIFAPLERELAHYIQSGLIVDWLGVRIDRSSREAIRKAYGEPVLCRVDDGGADRMDEPAGQSPGWGIRRIDEKKRMAMLPALKALGNAITPQQAYAVARCILHAEMST